MITPVQWTFTANIDPSVQNEKHLFHLSEKGRWVVTASLANSRLTVLLRTYAKDAPLKLEADLKKYVAGTASANNDRTTAPGTASATTIELIWLGYRLELWINGVMAEEEWPMGESFKNAEPKIVCASCVLSSQWLPTAEVRAFRPRPINDILFWAPDLGNENVGDCMPFAEGDTYHLFYLKDRHSHRSKWGKGAHQFAHISTKDLIHWEEHPMAIEITHPWEGSICTGSVLKANGRYYAFYAARMMDETAAQLSWAVSDDGIHFTKSEKYFSLTDPYETTSARDPEVFPGADGQYHMLVTTNLALCDVPERSGCLAHLVSADLENWEQKEPFLVPGYTDQPECSDYFEWNGWYYLIFSNYGLAKYRYSRHPFGPWICPENETIGGPLYRVPKTADFHGRRIAAGFLAGQVDGNSYAGSLILRELTQNEDGTLNICHVKELKPMQAADCDAKRRALTLEITPQNAYRQTKLTDAGWYLRCRITPQNCSSFGLILKTANNSYEIRLDSAWRRVSVCPAHTNLYNGPACPTLENVDGLKNCCTVEIFWKKGVLDLCINQQRTLVCRLEAETVDAVSESALRKTPDAVCAAAAPDTTCSEWSCYVKDGQAAFEVWASKD